VTDLDTLKRLFDFTDDDLAANRAGRLSERQRAALRREVSRQAVDRLAARLTYPLVVLLIVLYFVIVPPLGSRLGPWTCAAIFLALLVITGAGYAWRGSVRWLLRAASGRPALDGWLRRALPVAYGRRMAAVERGEVLQKSGTLTVWDDGEHRHLFLNDEELQNNAMAEQDKRLWKLPPDREYHFYLLPETGWIVAAEPVE
jgi:hypothetical protein